MGKWDHRAGFGGRAAAICAGTLATVAIGAGTASADSLVYVKSGYVYVANGDGSGARPVTSQSQWWAWPSETDAGIIAVAGSPSRIDGQGDNPSGSDQIYEFDQQGLQVAGPVNTEGSYSTVGDPVYVSHVRVAPDNSNVAWTVVDTLISDPYAAWRNPNGSGTFQVAQDSGGAPLPYSGPEWWGAARLLITHDGVTFGNAEYALYNVQDGSSPGWSDDQAIGNSGSYQVVFSRQGTKSAVMTDDGPDHSDGSIQNVAITLETSTGDLPNTDWSDTNCTITLPASEYQSSSGALRASMSFSSDGNTLAWAQDDGVYEANVSNPASCATVTSSVHLVVPGGAMPFLGAAALSPPAPSSGGSGGSGSSGGSGGSGGGTHHSGPTVRILSIVVAGRRHAARIRLAGRGSGRVTFQCRLDRGRRWHPCRSGDMLRHLSRGRHTLFARAHDSTGYSNTARRAFRIR